MFRKINPSNGKGCGCGSFEGKGAGDWKNLLADNLPLQKGAPKAAVIFTPISRRVLDSLVRASHADAGREEIVKMVKENGANLSREDIEALAGAIAESKAGVIWGCRLLGALLDNVEARPDTREVAVTVANNIKANMLLSFNAEITTLDYDDAANICRAATMLGMPQMWGALQKKMDWIRQMADAFGEKSDDSNRELKKKYLESWHSSIAAALEHNAPFEIVLYAAEQDGGKCAISCLWAAREFEAPEKELLVKKIDAMLEVSMPHISMENIQKLSDVPESMQSERLWASIESAFRALLKSDESKDNSYAMGILPIVPGKRRARFVESALGSSAIPLADGISALCGMAPEFQSEALWNMARTEFAAMVKSGNTEWMRTAKAALKVIPPGRVNEFLHEAGMAAAEGKLAAWGAGGEAARGNSQYNGVGKRRKWGIFRWLFG